MSTIVTFGKYKGRSIDEVPQDYLEWVVDSFDKSVWIIEAARELITRGDATPILDPVDAGTVTAVRYHINGQRKTRNIIFTLVPSSDSKPAGPDMGVVTVPPPLPEFMGDIKAGYALDILRHEARSQTPFFLLESAKSDLDARFHSDLLVLSRVVTHPDVTLAREACIYGKLAQENWVRERVECSVTLNYLGLHWKYSVKSGQMPELSHVE
jgi:hypothetical protein